MALGPRPARIVIHGSQVETQEKGHSAARSSLPTPGTLSSLFAADEAWEEAFLDWEGKIPAYESFQGKLGRNAETLAAALAFDLEVERSGERLGSYASLRSAEDTANSVYQRMQGRWLNVASRAAEAASYLRPEILAVPAAKMKRFLADPRLAAYRILLERLLEEKPHTLSEKEERLLAMQTEMAQTASQAFGQLNDADLKFGAIRDDKGRPIELTHATFQTLLHSPKRSVRKTAFHQLYRQYAAHEHALAATLAGSVHRDVYYARARNHPSALEAAMFPDRVPAAVYENLVASVRAHLPALHRYYGVRRRAMKLREIHHYDTYVPILAGLEARHTWDQAVEVVIAALRRWEASTARF